MVESTDPQECEYMQIAKPAPIRARPPPPRPPSRGHDTDEEDEETHDELAETPPMEAPEATTASGNEEVLSEHRVFL